MAFLYDPMNIRSWNPSECNGGGEFSFIAAQQLVASNLAQQQQKD
jgi:hypothetical protein